MVEHIDFRAHEKKKSLERLLEGRSIYLHINTSIDGLIVPEHLLEQKSVTLQVSYEFRTALTVNTELVNQDLLFDGSYFSCEIPLEAIWGASGEDGESLFWEECAPEGMFGSESSEETGEEEETEEDTAEKPQKGAPVLKLIK